MSKLVQQLTESDAVNSYCERVFKQVQADGLGEPSEAGLLLGCTNNLCAYLDWFSGHTKTRIQHGSFYVKLSKGSGQIHEVMTVDDFTWDVEADAATLKQRAVDMADRLTQRR